MKNKSLIFNAALSCLTIAFLAVLVWITKDNNLSDREKFSQYLMAEYSSLPQLGEADQDKLAKPDRPDLAAIQNYYMMVDPKLQRVPTERLKIAYLETERIRQENFSRGYSSSALQWTGTGATMGGRTRAIMYDPNDPGGNKVWAGSVTGGLWVNYDITNMLDHWTPINDFWDNLSISCITYDPNNTQTYYVGTGEAETALIIYRESSSVGMGIMVSYDAGDTWDLLPSTVDFKYVTDIEVRDEDGTSVIYAGVVSGSYFGAIHQSLPSDGLYRSTDGGTTWDQVLPDITGQSIPYAVSDIELGADGRIYVGTMQNVNIEGGGIIFYSDEGTPGSWTMFNDVEQTILAQGYYNIPGRVVLAAAPSDANRIYALYAVGFDDGFIYYRSRYIQRSDDKGQNWTNLTLPDTDYATLAWHALMAGVDPNDPDHIYVGGLDVWKSADGGWTWNHVSDWSLMYYSGGPDYVHADQHVSLFKPGSSDEILFACDGGVFYTSNGTSPYPTFEEMNQGYNTLQFYSCDINPILGEDDCIGGLQDNGSLFYTGSPLSIDDMVSGGDGAYCFYDKDEPNIFITSVYYNRYSVFVNGYMQNYINEYSGTFISPADYDYNNNTLYANACHFFGNNADRILRVSGLPYGSSSSFLSLNTGTFVPFSHLKYSPYSPAGKATLFIGTQSGNLYRVDEAQSSPLVQDITGTNFPTANISCVAIGQSEDTLLVTFSNYGVNSIWQTYDGGITWEPKQGNLPDMPVRWALYHPNSAKQAVLATEIGIWSTNTLHLQDPIWEPAVDGLANVRIDMLKLRESDNTILAATHGRGLYTAIFENNPYVNIDELTEEEVAIYPNPSNGKFRLSFNANNRENLSIRLINMDGKIIESNEIDTNTGYFQKDYDLSGYSPGTYILQIIDNKTKLVKKVLVF